MAGGALERVGSLVATQVSAYDRRLSRFEDDALQKISVLEQENVRAIITLAGGTLHRFLGREEIEPDLQRFFDEHSLEEVQRLYNKSGPFRLPTKVSNLDGWRLRVTLTPPRPGVNSAGGQGQIADELRAFRPPDDPLILMANVSNRPDFDSFVHGREILFSEDGIWSPQHMQRDHPAAVIFVRHTNAYAAAFAEPCLFVNPSVDPAAVPQALLRLPHAHGPDGFVRVEGESLACILGVP